MSWIDAALSIVFILTAVFLLRFSYESRWNTYLRLNLLQKQSISGGVLPPRPSFRRRKNAASSSRISYAATAFTHERALRSFSRYQTLARNELSSKRKGLSALRGRHARIADEIGYGDKLDRLGAAIDINNKVASAITRHALLEDEGRVLGDTRITLYGASRWTDDGPTDLARVVEALKHCVRDWSVDGLEERTRVFAPILDVLAQVPTDKRKDTKVLVPGAGLGRLGWEIACMGFDVTINEVSSYMTLPLKMLLSDETTPTPNCHISASFPDVLPRTDPDNIIMDLREVEDVQPKCTYRHYTPGGKFELVELDFLSLVPPNRDKHSYSAHTRDVFQNGLPSMVAAQPQDRGYDFIVTLFFIDTATNILAYLDQIYALLRRRSPALTSNNLQQGTGTWVNLGPLLWPSGASLEPSLEEVLAMSERVGLDVVSELPSALALGQDEDTWEQSGTLNPLEARRTLECQYTANRAGMMKWMYQAEFWVARRREE
ncbi:hypothetical protein FRC07_004911 [Ceratobasidium sp. 392]|nr:hypothetical protein FRC07_004911 [Ceratobasidium sp. 392]